MSMSFARRCTLSLGLCTVALATLGGCAKDNQWTVHTHSNGMPRYMHEHENWWHYQFVYHPSAQVYFEPYTGTYFWHQDGGWWSGPELPRGMTLSGLKAVVVKTNSPVPHMHHESIVALNGPHGSNYRGSGAPFVGVHSEELLAQICNVYTADPSSGNKMKSTAARRILTSQTKQPSTSSASDFWPDSADVVEAREAAQANAKEDADSLEESESTQQPALTIADESRPD